MDLASPTVHKSGNSLHVTHSDDKNCFVEFHIEAVKHEFESEKSGHPVFKNIPYITITFPGDNTKRVVRPVKMESDVRGASDPERWPRQWDRFQRQAEQVQDGTPLEQWPPVTKADVLMFKAQGIHTVEALAAVSDANLERLGPGVRGFRTKAQDYLEAAKGGEAMAALRAENKDLHAKFDALQAQFNDLAERAASPEGETRGRGRRQGASEG